MIKNVVLLDTQIDGVIPINILDRICFNISSFNDLINFSLINKKTYNYVMNNNGLWIQKLEKIGVWDNNNNNNNNNNKSNDLINSKKIEDVKLTPLNCLDNQIDNPDIARIMFIKIYSILSPILKQLLIDNYSNFQNLNIFNEFSTPISQAKLFTNIGNFLQIYYNYNDFNTLIMRLNNILNLFVSSLITEIGIQLKDKKYSIVLNLITALDYLNFSNNKITIDPLESLLEFFISKNNDAYTELLNNDLSNECFIKEPENSTKRGIVKGYSFNFNKIDEILNQIKDLLNDQLDEIDKIFRSGSNMKIKGRNIDEIPIIFKILENFLSIHLVSGLFDRIILKAKQIDSLDEINNSKIPNDDESIDSENPNINIMNEHSLFFQCVPYIYSKTIIIIQNLKYPQTEILLDNNQKTKMNYIKVVCEFVNYYYEQYLIDFSNELPTYCHISLIQLIKSWQSNNQKAQKNVENEILKLVDDDDENNKKSNFEIFTTFTNLFTFKTKQENKTETPEINDKEGDEKEQVKLTKMAAKLKILIGKVETMKTLVSIDLTVLLLQHIKNSYDLLLDLTKYSITEQLNKQIFLTCTNIFNDMLTILINNHIKPGFIEALQRLKNYKPINLNSNGIGEYENKSDGTLEPVNNFIELVDVGDLILQMINVFYNHELIQNGIIPIKNQHSRDFLRMNNIEKSIKLLESSLDTYVANGLDISIDIIISEIRYKVEECVGPIPLYNNDNKSKSANSTINSRPNTLRSKPPQSSSSSSTTTTGAPLSIRSNINNNSNINSIHDIESTVYNYQSLESLPLNEGHTSEWCTICLEVLKSHFSLLQDSIDKSIMDVFKQELGDRLITLLIQLLMKKFKISIIGGIQFSFDINSLYKYYQINRIKPAIEYLVGFKKIDQLYLIDCSGKSSKEFKPQCKELGKLIIDLGRENGVFTPEEVYQFVSRRSDWDKIKRNIDKVVYGFGADDCIIM
jgi:recyclin-1